MSIFRGSVRGAHYFHWKASVAVATQRAKRDLSLRHIGRSRSLRSEEVQVKLARGSDVLYAALAAVWALVCASHH